MKELVDQLIVHVLVSSSFDSGRVDHGTSCTDRLKDLEPDI